MFNIYGGAAEFKQWELDKFVTNSCMKEGDEVVFRNSHGETYVVKAFSQGAEILADVPNYLLRTADNILVDLEQGNDRHPECRTTFTVVAQDKPDGYECKYNVPERQSASSGGSGLPSGSKPNQYIVTDGDGNAKWENKLCGSEISVSVIYSNPEITMTNDHLNYREFGTFLDFDMAPLVIGQKYIVVYNGVEYDCTASRVWDEACIGNPNVADESYEDNGVPFAIQTSLPGEGANRVIKFRDGAGTYSIEISAVEETITKISGKYVEGMGWSEPVVLLKESDAAAYEHPSFGKAWLIENAPKLTVGETYTVTYNGNDYNCVCQSAPYGLSEDVNAVAMGNFSVAGGQDTGEPFAMMISAMFNRVDVIDLSGASAVKVKIVGEAVHPIEKKYMPRGFGLSIFYFNDDKYLYRSESGNQNRDENDRVTRDELNEAIHSGGVILAPYDGSFCYPEGVEVSESYGSVSNYNGEFVRYTKEYESGGGPL